MSDTMIRMVKSDWVSGLDDRTYGCDGDCAKAWGLTNRPTDTSSGEYLSDSELGLASPSLSIGTRTIDFKTCRA